MNSTFAGASGAIGRCGAAALAVVEDQPGQVRAGVVDLGEEAAQKRLAFQPALGEAVQRLGLQPAQRALETDQLLDVAVVSGFQFQGLALDLGDLEDVPLEALLAAQAFALANPLAKEHQAREGWRKSAMVKALAT